MTCFPIAKVLKCLSPSPIQSDARCRIGSNRACCQPKRVLNRKKGKRKGKRPLPDWLFVRDSITQRGATRYQHKHLLFWRQMKRVSLESSYKCECCKLQIRNGNINRNIWRDPTRQKKPLAVAISHRWVERKSSKDGVAAGLESRMAETQKENKSSRKKNRSSSRNFLQGIDRSLGKEIQRLWGRRRVFSKESSKNF